MLGFTDIETDDDGDLVVDPRGDLKIASTRRTAIQSMIFRLRTIIGDYVPDASLGSDIPKMYGRPNTRHNGSLIASMAKRALTVDGRFSTNEFTLDVTPVSPESIIIVLRLINVFYDLPADEQDQTVLKFLLNYEEGTFSVIGNESAPV